MSSEMLTQKALERHDRVDPKMVPSKERATPSKDEPKSVKGRRSRLLSKTDSTKSIHNGSFRGISRLYSRTESNRSLPNGTSDVGISSRHSMTTPQPTAGLSVFRLIAAARAWKRMSQKKLAVREKPKVEMENTYRLGPNTGEKFLPRKVESMIDDVLTRYLRHFKYVPEASKQMCLAISSEVKSRVKSLGFPRYKFVCLVFLFQNKGQGTEIGSRCLWSPATDSSASCTYKNNQFICVVNVHAVYFE